MQTKLVYSPQLVEWLLSESGLSEGINAWDLTAKVHSYYYSYQHVTSVLLLEDIQRYRTATGKQWGPRSVVFLCKMPRRHLAAMILHFSENGLVAWLVCENPSNEWIALWAAQLKVIYPDIPQRIEVQPIQASTYSDVLFAEMLLQLAHQQSLGTLDLTTTLQSHQVHFQKKFIQRWQLLKREEPVFAKAFTVLFKRLLKYAKLNTFRVSEKNQLSQASLYQISQYVELDCYRKQVIYQAPIDDIAPFLNQLSFRLLVNTLNLMLVSKTPDCLSLFQSECQRQFKQMAAWEADIQQQLTRWRGAWRVYLPYIGQTLAMQLYVHSFIGLGAELLPLLIESILQQVNSTTLLHRIPMARRALLWKLVGGSIGLSYSFWLGGYTFCKVLGAGYIGQKWQARWEAKSLNDEQACYQSRLGFTKEGLSGKRCIYFIIALLESLWLRRWQPLSQAVGGTIGSLLSAAGIRRQLPSNTTLTSEQISILLLGTWLGYDIGSIFATYLEQGIHKTFTREALHEAFCKLAQQRDYQGCTSYFPQTPYHLSFWSNPQDNVRLGWQTEKLFRESTCEVIPVLSGETFVLCDAPRETGILRLNEF